jgi:hypothetical protein
LPGRTIRSVRPSWEAFEDRIAPAGLTEFVDPDPALGNHFGATVVALRTGNVVITSPDDNAGGTGAGAVYLFNGATGALISTLTGSQAGDHIGSVGVTALSNGNYVVDSPYWHNGAGAVTWGSGTAGVSGDVSPTNSLVGSTANEDIGDGVTALSNGNYVVSSPYWHNGAGAVTWGSGTAGVSGIVSATNSLVGSKANDQVGSGEGSPSGNVGGVTALSNGNYVVSSPNWHKFTGAVTWVNGTAGVRGTVSAANSLVGSKANEQVGGGDVTALSNGNYVVSTPLWHNSAGAVTWGSGTAGVRGHVSATNSLIGGSTSNSFVSSVTALSNGNYVVSTPGWNNGAGAVTWGSGTAGVRGTVSATNSLVGSTANDQVGSGVISGVTALSNGNYVVDSPSWHKGAGAVTWGSGTAGVRGTVSAANSLVGSTANGSVGSGLNGGVTALSNGNYVVSSSDWNNGAGAVTWGSGTAGVSGNISTMNSAIGSAANSGLRAVVVDNVNGTFFAPFVTDGGGRVRVGSQTTGFAAAPTLPQELAVAGVSSKKGLTSFTVSYNGPLSSSPASRSGPYQVFAAVTRIVKEHQATLFTRALAIRSVSPTVAAAR